MGCEAGIRFWWQVQDECSLSYQAGLIKGRRKKKWNRVLLNLPYVDSDVLLTAGHNLISPDLLLSKPKEGLLDCLLA